jgi:sugar phosphate isomerase/epimerase
MSLWDVGIASLRRTVLTKELFEEYKKAEIKAMEVSLNYNMQGLETARDIFRNCGLSQAVEYAKESGVELWSYHLPFCPFEDIDISTPSMAEESVKMILSYIDRASVCGFKVYVIHPSTEPIDENDRPARMECAKKSLVLIAEHLKSKNAVLAVEDLPRTCLGRNSSDILELCSAHPSLRACFDTNHLLGEDITEFIRKTGHLYVTTHVSDYDFINERHWLCGEGKIDWISLKKELEAVGYDGPWLYEISLETNPKTIDRDRDLIYSDFADNYAEIMSGNAPKGVGQGKEDLPMFP